MMSKAVWFISYRLVEGASEQDFLLASKKVHDEILSRQKGFISWEVLVHGDLWVDLVTWETMDDARNGETAGGNNPVAQAFYAYIDMNSCKSQSYSVVKSY